MENYTKYARGSEWRRWDLHIHTPGTKKNDQFTGANIDEKWQKYIEDINAYEDEIAVVGITDYFCLENYFKFKVAIKENRIKKNFEMVLPNIEIRVLPVTGSATPINIHCIFNPVIDTEIETRFLSKLKFHYNDSDYSAKKEELIRLGRSLPGKSLLDSEAAFKEGVSQYVVSIDILRGLFEKDAKLRENTIIVVSNKSTDGNSGIRNHKDFFITTGQSQLDATEWGIYQFSDAIFSSSESDVFYFTAQGPDKKNLVIEKCKTLMPCFHGCDAHENSKIFKPDENRYCWIKSDPTFEGLKQTLYEPKDRVKIQSLKPEVKIDRFIISELNFSDSGNLFGNQKILLNDNLNSIIGGKSSGKSLLLYSIANCIDPEQVERTSKRLGFDGYNFKSNYGFEVFWKNGEKDNNINAASNGHKITYIPQLYINHLVEKNNKEELNNLIENILLQDTDYKHFYETQKQLIGQKNKEIDNLVINYLQTRTKALEVQEKSKNIGKSDAIIKGIATIQKTIEDVQKLTNFSQQEITEYNSLISSRTSIEKYMKELNEEETALSKIRIEIKSTKESLFGKRDFLDEIEFKGSIDRIIDEITNVSETILSVKNKAESDFDTLIANLDTEIRSVNIENRRIKLKEDLASLNEKLFPLLKKLEGQQELSKLTTSIENENQKLQQALNHEKQFTTLIEDYNNLRKQTVVALKSRIALYESIVQKINETKQNIDSEITLRCSLLYKQSNFLLFEQANKAAIAQDNYLNTLLGAGLVKYGLIPDLYSNALRVTDDKLIVSNEISIPLKVRTNLADVLRGLTKDSFELDYTVTYKDDDLLSMSPGKKGTVLLILFLQISSSEFPILIDQPEDNLDNRTIYDLLCQMIKEKKKERQIIIVSHNANLVVATDSENIIVANQEAQSTIGIRSKYRFEYVNGSLEHSFVKNEKMKEILYQQGIKEHVCDILEGGDEAFKQREKKYSIKI